MRKRWAKSYCAQKSEGYSYIWNTEISACKHSLCVMVYSYDRYPSDPPGTEKGSHLMKN